MQVTTVEAHRSNLLMTPWQWVLHAICGWSKGRTTSIPTEKNIC